MNKAALVFSTCSLILALVVPAAAQTAHHRVKNAPRDTIAAGDPQLPVENALRWGYSQGYSSYPSGFGGLYGDGRYPGNVISSGKDRP